MIDGRFKVDVDTTDFGHIIGEGELTRTLQCANGEHGEEEEEKGKKLKEKMDQEIKAFMQSYPQAFPAGRPLGKLSAYFHRLGIMVRESTFICFGSGATVAPRGLLAASERCYRGICISSKP